MRRAPANPLAARRPAGSFSLFQKETFYFEPVGGILAQGYRVANALSLREPAPQGR